MHQVAASALVELHRASMQEGAAFEVRGVFGSSSHSLTMQEEADLEVTR